MLFPWEKKNNLDSSQALVCQSRSQQILLTNCVKFDEREEALLKISACLISFFAPLQLFFSLSEKRKADRKNTRENEKRLVFFVWFVSRRLLWTLTASTYGGGWKRPEQKGQSRDNVAFNRKPGGKKLTREEKNPLGRAKKWLSS